MAMPVIGITKTIILVKELVQIQIIIPTFVCFLGHLVAVKNKY